MESLAEDGRGTPVGQQTGPRARSDSAGAEIAAESADSTHTPRPLHIGISPGEEQPQFLVTTFKNGELTDAALTRQEVLALDPEEVDFFWDRTFGRVSIRRADGTIPKSDGEIPGLGPDTGIPFLEDIVWGLGELLTVERLNGRLDSLWFSGPRAALVRRLRRAFGDSASLQWYFIVKSRPWRIAWNQARSWRNVERLAKPSSKERPPA